MAKPDLATTGHAQIGWPERFLFIGCGNMAGAMLSRWVECGLPPERVTVVRPSGAPVLPGVTVTTRLDAPVTSKTVIVLGCKPQQLGLVARDMAPLVGAGSMILSILAGVPLTQLDHAFPRSGTIIRCMPNLPVRIGKGICILGAGQTVGDDDRAMATRLCSQLGLVEWLPDERLFDAATALAGCGPAFVYRFVDALATAGAELGLDADAALRMALAMVEGAALSAAASSVSPSAMADAVASKGGMTREGLDVIDRPDGLAALVGQTLRAARDRGAELAALSGKSS